MIENVRLCLVDYDSDPCAVIDGPLCVGYREYAAGRKNVCREIIAAFLASVYGRESRRKEFSTERYVRQIYFERGLRLPEEKTDADPAIVREAAGRRCDRLHLPVLESILRRGYRPELGTPLTMTGLPSGRYLVHDGKNRSSILAALGQDRIPNVEVTRAG